MSPADRCRFTNTIESAYYQQPGPLPPLPPERPVQPNSGFAKGINSTSRGRKKIMMFSDSRAGEEKEEVTMDTSENRPENEVPEPPLPVADQVSNDERPEGGAEEEEKKEVLLPRKTLSKYLMYGNPPVKYNPAQLANR